MKTLEADPLRAKAQNCFLESGAVTNPGCNKETNEDAILDLCEYGIFCVADGTGGPIGGQKASEEIVDAIQQKFWDTKFEDVESVLSTVKEALGRSKIRIKRIANEIGIEEMGAAVAILHLNPIKNSAFIVHAGDCRVYRYRDSSLSRLTKDHSVAAEMGLSDGDDISHIVQEKLTKAVGLYDRINPETISVDFLPGDYYLLTSSGFSRYLKDSDIIASITKYGRSDVFQAANDMVTKAKGMKATEDVSVILVKIEEEAQAEEAVIKKKSNRIPILVGFALALLFGIVITFTVQKNKKKQSLLSEDVHVSSKPQSNQAKAPENEQQPSNLGENGNSIPTEKLAKSQLQDPKVTGLENNSEPKSQIARMDALASIEEVPIFELENAEPQIVENEKLNSEESVHQQESQLKPAKEPIANEMESSKKAKPEKGVSLKQETNEPIEIDLAMSDQNPQRILIPGHKNSLQKRISNGEKGLLPPISIKNPPLGESRIEVNLYNSGAIEVIKETSADSSSTHEHVDGKPAENEGIPVIVKETEGSAQNPPNQESVGIDTPKNQTKKSVAPDMISEDMTPQTETGSLDSAMEPSPSENSETEEMILKEFRAQVAEGGLWAAIVDVNEKWSLLKSEEKIRVQNNIMKEFVNLCLEFRNNNYKNGDRVWEVLKIAPQIKDPVLSGQIAKLLTNFENDFENEINGRIEAAQLNCYWDKVNSVLQDNPEISVQIISTNLINYIDRWSSLSQGNSDLDLKNYFERSRNIYKKIEPLLEGPAELEDHLTLNTELEILPPLEICQRISETRLDIQTKLHSAIERILSNFSIINVGELESIMYSVYPDDQNSNWQIMKLKIVSDGMDKLVKLTNRMNSQKALQFPMKELSMFEKNAQELNGLLEEAQDHLLFVSILLGELEKQSKAGDHSLFSDGELLSNFKSRFQSTESIFSTETARNFGERFSQSLLSENY